MSQMGKREILRVVAYSGSKGGNKIFTGRSGSDKHVDVSFYRVLDGVIL